MYIDDGNGSLYSACAFLRQLDDDDASQNLC